MTIRWQCDKRGCYKDYCIPSWGILDDSFPGKITVSDIDGTVEINGYFLFLEWKGDSSPMTTGQKKYHENLTLLSEKITVYVIRGEIEKEEVSGVQIVRNGETGDLISADNNKLAEMCRRWGKHVAPDRYK